MSKDTQEALLKQLKNPFKDQFVKWRVGATNAEKTKGIALAYVDSREVTKRLDEVCGLGGWQSRLIRTDGGFICEIGIEIDGQWIWKSNAAGDTKVEPIKGGASDAFKRAASSWGVGRYLYYLPNVWVPISGRGNSFVLAEIPELPDWAKFNSNIEKWEDVAELEVTAEASMDEQGVIENVLTTLAKIEAAKTSDELAGVVAEMSPEELVGLASQLNVKTKELLAWETTAAARKDTDETTSKPASSRSTPAKS
jgi:hypothetical protein